MARPRKTMEEGESVPTMADEYLPLVKFVTASIALKPTDSGAAPIRVVDQAMSKWVEKGYTLKFMFQGESVVGDHVNVVGVFVKNVA